MTKVKEEIIIISPPNLKVNVMLISNGVEVVVAPALN